MLLLGVVVVVVVIVVAVVIAVVVVDDVGALVRFFVLRMVWDSFWLRVVR